MEWYENLPHIGYGLDGKKILKSSVPTDELSAYLQRKDDPDYFRKLHDAVNDRDIILTQQEY